MKRVVSFLLLLFAVFFTSYAQLVTTVDSTEFKKLRIFVDDFNDNRFEWIYDNSGLNKIVNGSLFYSNPFEYPYYDGKPIMLDESKNFEFETKLKFISGDVSKFNGLFWGDLIFGDKMFFGISSMGEFVVMKNSGFNDQVIHQQKSSVINRADFNSLKVVKIADKFIFFINDQKVYEMPYEKVGGNYFGFCIAPKSYVQINYLKIWYLQQL